MSKVYEAITEELIDGGQQSRLEHVWLFDVTRGDAEAFVVSGFHDSETENFGFDYSTDGVNWTPMSVRLTNSIRLFEFPLPPGIRGPLRVRVTDSNRYLGDSIADSVYIEDMYIRSARTAHPELPELSVSDSIITEAPDGTAVAQFLVTRSGNSATSVTFTYETVDGSAVATEDYTPIQRRTALLGSGVTQRIISVPILDDSLAENEETFFLRLSRPVGANISDAEGQATIGEMIIAFREDGSSTMVLPGTVTPKRMRSMMPPSPPINKHCCQVRPRLLPTTPATVAASTAS